MISFLKYVVLTVAVGTFCFALACGSDSETQQNPDFAEFQSTVIAILSEDREGAKSLVQANTPVSLEPLATYTPLPTQIPLTALEPLATYTPLPTQIPLATLEPLATYTPLPTQIPQPTYTPLPTAVLPTATPTLSPTPTLTPTPIGYEAVSAQSGIIVIAGGGLQGTFSGAIDSPGESDTYTFNAAKGQNLAVTMASTEIDALVELIDPDGQREMRVDDVGSSTNASFTRALSKTGTYLLIARGATSGLTDYGNYTVNFTLSAVSN